MGNIEGLKDKLAQLPENKKIMLLELEERKKVWRDSVQNLIDEIMPVYQPVLATVGASGAIRLDEGDEIDETGLQLLVGYKGRLALRAGPLHAERGRAVGGPGRLHPLAAEQDHLPLRAMDEFDIHMDPRTGRRYSR